MFVRQLPFALGIMLPVQPSVKLFAIGAYEFGSCIKVVVFGKVCFSLRILLLPFRLICTVSEQTYRFKLFPLLGCKDFSLLPAVFFAFGKPLLLV